MKLKRTTAAGKIEVSLVSFSISILAEKRLDGITNDVDENSIGGASPLQWKKTILLFFLKKAEFLSNKDEKRRRMSFFPEKGTTTTFEKKIKALQEKRRLMVVARQAANFGAKIEVLNRRRKAAKLEIQLKRVLM